MEESIQQFDLILMNKMVPTTPSKDIYGEISDGTMGADYEMNY